MIVDNKIPYIQKAIERIADEVVYIPGKDFTPELVRDADALISVHGHIATASYWKAAK